MLPMVIIICFFFLLAQITDVLKEVLSELAGRSLECQDPDDGIVDCRKESTIGM